MFNNATIIQNSKFSHEDDIDVNGGIWRNYNAKLVKMTRDLARNKDVNERIEEYMKLIPKNIKLDKQWEKFVKEKFSSKFQVRKRH